jgi:hypothetical protein
MYLSNIQVALVFDLDDKIIFTLGERLKEAQKKYVANLQLLNVPNGAPHEAPRLLFMTQSFNLNISLNRADIFINVPEQIKSNLNACLNYSYNVVNNLYALLFANSVKYNWCGIILNLCFPSEQQPSLKAIEKIAPYIIKIDSDGREMASFNLQIGFREPPYFKNITINGYEQSQLKIPTPQEQTYQQINFNDAEIVEAGISIILDVNNIPQINKIAFEGDFADIIKKMESSYTSLLDELNISGMI